jgi:capsular polysaccharide biosynthesis protein
MASKLATTVREKAAEHIKEVMNSEAVNVVEEAEIPQSQTMYNYQKNGLAGVILGMAIAIGIIVLQYMMNDTVKNAEDVERYLGLSVLGSIPIMEKSRRKDKSKKKQA